MTGTNGHAKRLSDLETRVNAIQGGEELRGIMDLGLLAHLMAEQISVRRFATETVEKTIRDGFDPKTMPVLGWIQGSKFVSKGKDGLPGMVVPCKIVELVEEETDE